MAKEINDYLTIADDNDLLIFTSAEKPRSLDHSSKDLTGTVNSEENKGIEEEPPTGPALPDPEPEQTPKQEDREEHTEIG